MAALAMNRILPPILPLPSRPIVVLVPIQRCVPAPSPSFTLAALIP